jgi:hypothetical protein
MVPGTNFGQWYWLGRPPGKAMCEKCVKLDVRIEDYRALAKNTLDGRALAALGSLIEECEAEKIELHPEGGTLGDNGLP